MVRAASNHPRTFSQDFCMRFAGFAVMCASFIGLQACTTISDLVPFGGDSGATPETATSTTPGLAIDRKTGYPPFAMMKGTVLIAPHGAKRTDFFFWMNEKKTENVIRYLQEENEYAGELTAHTADLQKKLREEIRARAAAAQGAPPFKDGGYWYYERYATGADFPVIARRKGTMTAAEEVLLDSQAEGPKHQQFKVNNYGASPDGTIFVYAVDYAGDRWHNIILRDVRTGEVLPDKIEYVAADFAFADDNKSLYYLKLQAGTARAYRLMLHTLGTDSKSDKLVFEEKDQQFELSLRRSKGGRVLLLTSEQTNTSEVRMLDAAAADAKWTVIRPRAKGVRYYAEELAGQLYILTNQGAPDFRVAAAALSAPSQWSSLIAQREGVYIEAIEVMKGGVVALDERTRGATQIRLVNTKTGEERLIAPDAAAGYMTFSDTYSFANLRNTDPETTKLRYAFSSLVNPDVIYDYDVATGTKTAVQRMAVPGFDPAAYSIERVFARAGDGQQIPVTIAYARSKFEKGENPVLVYGYGAYGSSNDPVFKAKWPSLMNRGFVIAFAHVRGGREMGEAWYQGGKLRNKKNTFTDFIAVAESLSKGGMVDGKRIFAMGRSAGGLLMGAVANMRPDLFKGIVAGVPFVDVVTTMLDESIPLTTFEYEEWGNPAEPGDYEYMLSYSPYDQVEKRAYPAMLVTAGFNDSQVGYFEPAKWVAKLRRNKTDQNPLIFRTNMTAGHSGDSGRFGRVEEDAFINAFLLDQAGLNTGSKTASAD
jgi:oligopeptidase B